MPMFRSPVEETPCWLVWAPLSEVFWLFVQAFIFGLSVLSHWSIHLYARAPALITVAS